MKTIVIVGLGQLGGVFAHALLRHGCAVVPANRGDDLHALAETLDPELVLFCVGEGELDGLLGDLPPAWKSKVGLLQNELLPAHWERHGITTPTVAVVWFEKKKPIVPHVIQSTPISGPSAQLLVNALGTQDLAAHVVPDDAIEDALVAKNVYILTANLGGLAIAESGDTTVGQLWNNHRELAEGIAREAIALQAAEVGHDLDVEGQLTALAQAFAADADHKAMGRSAPARLERAKRAAEARQLHLPSIEALANRS